MLLCHNGYTASVLQNKKALVTIDDDGCVKMSVLLNVIDYILKCLEG